MKRCPVCHRFYADDAPNICDVDFARLISDAPSASDPRASSAAAHTPQSNAPTPAPPAQDFHFNQVSQWQTVQPTSAGAGVSSSMTPRADMNPLRNYPRRGWIIFGVSLIIFAAEFLAGLMFSKAGGRITLGYLPLSIGTLSLIGVIYGLHTALMMPRQVRQVDAMLAGQNLLARWTYAPDEWTRFIESEFARVRRLRIGLLLWFPLGMLVMGGIFGFISARRYSNSPVLFSLLAGGVGLLVGLYFGGLDYREVARRRDIGAGIIYISPVGVLTGGRFYTWDLYASRLRRVAYVRGDPDEILFSYINPRGRTRSNTIEVRVPVPHNQQADAARVVTHFHS